MRAYLDGRKEDLLAGLDEAGKQISLWTKILTERAGALDEVEKGLAFLEEKEPKGGAD